MQVAINRTVSYEVAKVEVGVVRISLDPRRNSLQFQVMYRWLAADGRVLRAASGIYLEEALAQDAQGAGQGVVGVLAALRQLMPARPGAMLSITFKDGELLLTAGALDSTSGTLRFVSAPVTDEALLAAGISRATLQGVVAAVAQALT